VPKLVLEKANKKEVKKYEEKNYSSQGVGHVLRKLKSILIFDYHLMLWNTLNQQDLDGEVGLMPLFINIFQIILNRKKGSI